MKYYLTKRRGLILAKGEYSKLQHLKKLMKGGFKTLGKEDYKCFGDAVGGKPFHPDLPQKELAELLDKTVLIKDATIIEDFNSKFGVSSFALLLVETSEGKGKDTVIEQFTTLCGGEVVVKKVRKALADNLLPLYGTISYNGKYYDIL